jgi:hypothetical protein
MTTWTSQELDAIDAVDELRIARRRRNGTLTKSTPVWVVRDGDDLYVRSYGGTASAWYREALRTALGRVQAGGVIKDVAFALEADPLTNDRLDDAYRTKYSRYGRSFVDPIVTVTARAATIKLIPGGMPPAEL